MVRWLLLLWCILLVYTIGTCLILTSNACWVIDQGQTPWNFSFFLGRAFKGQENWHDPFSRMDTCRNKSRKREKSCRRILLGHGACWAELAREETEMCLIHKEATHFPFMLLFWQSPFSNDPPLWAQPGSSENCSPFQVPHILEGNDGITAKQLPLSIPDN